MSPVQRLFFAAQGDSVRPDKFSQQKTITESPTEAQNAKIKELVFNNLKKFMETCLGNAPRLQSSDIVFRICGTHDEVFRFLAESIRQVGAKNGFSKSKISQECDDNEGMARNLVIEKCVLGFTPSDYPISVVDLVNVDLEFRKFPKNSSLKRGDLIASTVYHELCHNFGSFNNEWLNEAATEWITQKAMDRFDRATFVASYQNALDSFKNLVYELGIDEKDILDAYVSRDDKAVVRILHSKGVSESDIERIFELGQKTMPAEPDQKPKPPQSSEAYENFINHVKQVKLKISKQKENESEPSESMHPSKTEPPELKEDNKKAEATDAKITEMKSKPGFSSYTMREAREALSHVEPEYIERLVAQVCMCYYFKYSKKPNAYEVINTLKSALDKNNLPISEVQKQIFAQATANFSESLKNTPLSTGIEKSPNIQTAESLASEISLKFGSEIDEQTAHLLESSIVNYASKNDGKLATLEQIFDTIGEGYNAVYEQRQHIPNANEISTSLLIESFENYQNFETRANDIFETYASKFSEQVPEQIRVTLHELVVSDETALPYCSKEFHVQTLAEIHEALERIYGDHFYASSQAGIICRMNGQVVPATQMTASPMRDLQDGIPEYTGKKPSFAIGVILKPEYVEHALDYAKQKKRKTTPQGDGEFAPEKTGGDMAQQLKFAVQPLDSGSKPQSLDDLVIYLSERCLTTEAELSSLRQNTRYSYYHLGLTAKIADSFVSMRKKYPVRSAPDEITRMIHTASMNYQKAHEVQPDMWDLTLQLLRDNNELVSCSPARPLELVPRFESAYRYVEKHAAAENLTLHDAFDWKHSAQMSAVILKFMDESRFASIPRTLAFTDLAMRGSVELLAHLNISDPTVQEVLATSLLLISEAAQPRFQKYSGDANELVQNAQKYLSFEFYKNFDFGYVKNEDGSLSPKRADSGQIAENLEAFVEKVSKNGV